MADFLYTIKAHPTTYAGVEFRSRLEATWAAFFDICGIWWQYEPIDLDGWTPDFGLRLSGALVLAEVKPVDPIRPEHFLKAYSRWEEVHVMLLGLNPAENDLPWFGMLLDAPSRSEHDWVTIHKATFIDDMDGKWKQAQNTTRWKGPR